MCERLTGLGLLPSNAVDRSQTQNILIASQTP